MTRMIAKAYRMADAVRAAGVPVVMGGPHVTEMADEALGRDGGPRHADAVALGEADNTWPRIVEDAARGQLKDIYSPVDPFGKELKPSLKPYPVIPGTPSISTSSIWCPRPPSIGWAKSARAGSIPHHSRRVGTRLSLRLRVLHRHRILRRFHPLSHQRKRGQRTPAAESARP